MRDMSLGLQTPRSFCVSEPHRLLCAGPPETTMTPRVLAYVLLLSVLLTCSLSLEDEDEDYEDVTVSQMLAPKAQDTGATQILNQLLREYDKKLRPDIGGVKVVTRHAVDPLVAGGGVVEVWLPARLRLSHHTRPRTLTFVKVTALTDWVDRSVKV